MAGLPMVLPGRVGDSFITRRHQDTGACGATVCFFNGSRKQNRSIIVDTAYRISARLGPGLLESVYETVFARDLSRRALYVERQKPISFDFEGLWFENALRIDLFIEPAVIVEIKSAKAFNPNDYKQVLTYLRLTDCRLGYLINFGAPTIKEGIKRIVN